MDLLSALHITKNFAGHLALDDVSIAVPRGSIFGLLGPNGAGKTTLIRIINRILAHDSGELLFEGRQLMHEDVARIGYLPEERGLYKKMKVGEQLLYFARLKGLGRSEAIASLKTWFEKFQLRAWWDRKVEELSKGMQQKVQFIATVVHRPALLIFDEPFSGFDPINTDLIKNEVLELRKKGASIIFSTHDMESAEEVCDCIALIHESCKILDGTLEEIRNRYRTHTFEIGFSGDPAALREALPEEFLLTETGGKTQARIKIPRDRSPNELLQRALAAVEVRAFREVLPSVRDVFIHAISEYEKDPAHH